MEREFEIGLPVFLVQQRWREYVGGQGAQGVEIHLDPAGGASTRVCLRGEGETVDDAALHFRRYLEAHGEGEVPLVGRMVSPGASGTGITPDATRRR